MPARSAGIVLYRRPSTGLEVLLVHPGGPFFARRDAGVWSIPKGEYAPDEDPLACARREFEEETGKSPGAGAPIALGEIRQGNGKVVTAWGIEGDLDPEGILSNTFAIAWPPGSGRMQEFPEVDRAGWFSAARAAEKLLAAQRPLIDRLVEALRPGAAAPREEGGDSAPREAGRGSAG